MLLKKATVADIPALLEVEKSVAGNKVYSPILDKEEWEEELKKCVVYLIEEEGRIAGDISYELKSPEHAYLSGLVVTPQFQGKGIARAALAQILDQLKDMKRIDLVTHPDNVAALKLYQSFGFIIETKKEDYYGDGESRLILVRINRS
ncbi:MAG: N-acetyltransferase GCN5 [Parcubacteria group bacterium LiPW_15]|nr:MAG: N-acetyltransferase GCN5 [Parcubacteria group bacterium LiPW_15]